MNPTEIKPKIFWIGVNDASTQFFEGLWPIKDEGISYNSYLINDQKKALIDMCKDVTSQDFLENLRQVVDPAALDSIIINHMEPDHSGALEQILHLSPKATIYCTERARAMLKGFFGIEENIHVIQDGELLPLGECQLQFFSTPNVHWPETMMTYETTHQVLFSCDGFGGYGKLESGIYDDTCENLPYYEQEALRYFSNIVASFSKPTLSAIEKLGVLPIAMVAPSHGLIWRKNPKQIIDLYQHWAEYARQPGEAGITLLHSSMYGNTDRLLPALQEGLAKTGIKVQTFNVVTTNFSYILPSLWTLQGVLIGAPTYEGRIFPGMAQVLDFAAAKHLPSRQVAYFGSYGWGGGALRQLTEKLANLKWELTDTLEFIGRPTAETMQHGREMGRKFGNLILGK